MLRKFPLTVVAVCLAALSASAFADTVTLKSGEKVEGKITAETATEITIEAKVAAGITDTRTIPKAEVASVSKEAPDEAAWLPLKNFKPGVNSLPAASYDAIINPLRGFAGQFPQSAHAAEAQTLADTFIAEKQRVEGGEVKLDGKWLSKDEVQKERYQINALLSFNFMKDQSTRDLVGAMNSFDVIEKTYPGARSFPDAVDLAKRVLAALKPEADRRIQSFTAAKTERDKAIKEAKGAQRTELEATKRRDEVASEAAVSAIEKQGLQWFPLNANSERALQRTSSRAVSESQRLAALPVAKMRESLQYTAKVREALDKKDAAAAEAALTQAGNAWNNNELLTRLRDEVSTARNAAATAAAAPESVAAPASTASTKSESTEALPEVPQDDPEKPFLLTPAGIIVSIIGLIFIIGAVVVFKKIKSKASDVLE
jgi:hypothetical protein